MAVLYSNTIIYGIVRAIVYDYIYLANFISFKTLILVLNKILQNYPRHTQELIISFMLVNNS